jgi:small subunit ribosomal protein S23e
MGKGQPRGLLAARKLRNTRRENQWADLHYKKRLLGTAFKSSPFGVRTTPPGSRRQCEAREGSEEGNALAKRDMR